jgi:hypothetical protein
VSKIILTLALFYFVPLPINGHDEKKCPLTKELGGWASGPIAFMVNNCYNTMNRVSIQNWGRPIIPFLGLNQCACVVDKTRRRFPCQEHYSEFVALGTSEEQVKEWSKECILEGAMGEEAKQAFIQATEEMEKAEQQKAQDNETAPKQVEPTPPSEEIKQPEDAKKEAPVDDGPKTWKDLSTQG